MRVSRTAAIAAFSSLCLGSTAAHADIACWKPKEREAAQVRAFQTMLMVGALHCRSRAESTAEAYNRFADNQRGALKHHAKALKRHFKRADRHGADALYDRYNTSIANQYSRNFDRGELCWTVSSLAKEAAEADREGLLALAASYTRPVTEPVCD